jgi:hypothetical protein
MVNRILLSGPVRRRVRFDVAATAGLASYSRLAAWVQS